MQGKKKQRGREAKRRKKGGGFALFTEKAEKRGGEKEKIDKERGKQGVPERNGETESKETEKKFSFLQKNQKGEGRN